MVRKSRRFNKRNYSVPAATRSPDTVAKQSKIKKWKV